MENLKCQKCKNAVICKFKDNMDKVEETFPFIASITCKFYEAPVKSESATKKEKAEKPAKAEKPVKETPKAEEIEEFPEINPPIRANEATLIKNKLIEASKPKSISENSAEEKPLTKEEKEEQFLALSIDKLGIRSATKKKLTKLGVVSIKDVYSIKPEDVEQQDITDINRQLSLFNKKPIKF